jgi:hypothetical protein
MKAKSKSSWLIDAMVVAAGAAAIMATTGGGARALPIAPAIGCQSNEGGAQVRIAVLRPDWTTVSFERDSATLTAIGAHNLQAAIQSYDGGGVMQLQISGVERPNRPSDHVMIDRVTTVAVVTALSGVPAEAISIVASEQQIGCAR